MDFEGGGGLIKWSTKISVCRLFIIYIIKFDYKYFCNVVLTDFECNISLYENGHVYNCVCHQQTFSSFPTSKWTKPIIHF